VNYIKHLSSFFEKVELDERISPFHISLYLSLFLFWNSNRFRNPISVSRNEIMKISKIGYFNTYTKCIKELDEFGYIRYIPSFNATKGSTVYLYTFDKADVMAEDSSLYTFDKGNGKALRPYINNKTIKQRV